MEFAAFFQLVAIGAMGVICAVLAWTVREVVGLTRVVSVMDSRQSAIEEENRICAADRVATSSTVGQMQTDVAVINERTYHQTKMLERIEANLPGATPRTRSRATK